ncbi:hypothetical protein SO802_006100 [Lithocarpus litseifolius]|uniref:Uncharacterized protein n=1 Tax=Lithocarpus litseifolius TaxID=425828 RepID=A0AAW2DKD2_9ROSI
MEDCTISRRRCLFKTKHCKTLVELEKGVDGLFGSFARLDSRISSVGLTAAKIDHLQWQTALKCDITEYGEFVCSFDAPIDENFEFLGI